MKAIVYSVTKLHAAGEAFEQQLPFQLAVIELSDDTRATVQIAGPAVEIGSTVVPDRAEPGFWRLSRKA